MSISAIKPADILLPVTEDMTSWAVIACDQFTSEKNYWESLENNVKGKKTTLNLILPEIYLDGSEDERIKKINENIREYTENGVFKTYKNGLILTVRKTPYSERRIGLIGALDLEEYEYKSGAKSLVRATEGTIEERIPPRLKIRKDAEVEFPHIMVLYDDEEKRIGEKAYLQREKYQKVYDFELNMGGGSIEGYFITDTEPIIKEFERLLDSARLIKKYGSDDKFLFAVGDGNHSLATAKTHWENLKKTLTDEQIKNHPARYALCEFVNIYDEGIKFEPIYRYCSDIERETFIKEFVKAVPMSQIIGDGLIKVSANGNLPESIKNTDDIIKKYVNEKGGKTDYVHGEKNLARLVSGDKNSVGILLDSLDKNDLFRYVSKFGALPRKTFSMGEGIEKRYYIEGRRIK